MLSCTERTLGSNGNGGGGCGSSGGSRGSHGGGSSGSSRGGGSVVSRALTPDAVAAALLCKECASLIGNVPPAWVALGLG